MVEVGPIAAVGVVGSLIDQVEIPLVLFGDGFVFVRLGIAAAHKLARRNPGDGPLRCRLLSVPAAGVLGLALWWPESTKIRLKLGLWRVLLERLLHHLLQVELLHFEIRFKLHAHSL